MNSLLRLPLSLALSVALVSPCTAVPAPAIWTQIGVAGAVRGSVQAFAPGAKPVGRILKSGQYLYLGETISTGSEGSLQVMLNDETVFTIGPKSSMVLDEFVYDPESHSGKVIARVKKGVFRFVTGLIGHHKPSDMTVKFPTAVMGIRGTIVAGEVAESGATTAVLLGPGPATNASQERVGAFTLENAGAKVDVVKPGYATYVAGAGAAPTAPALLPQGQLQSILEGLASSPRAASGQPASATSPSDQPSDASATDASDQGTAQAEGDLSNTQDVTDLSNDLSNATLNAANDIGNPDLAAFIAANQSSWDDVRSITSGTGYYSGTDNFYLSQCAGGACAGPSGSISMYLTVDFGLKTVGGGASNVTISATDPALPAPISDTVNFAIAKNFAALSGPATLSGTSGSGTTANVSILNLGGPAQSAVAVASYNANGTVGSGAVLGSLTCTTGACH